MKKLSISRPEVTEVSEPTIVATLQQSGTGIVIRYFEIPEVTPADAPIADSIGDLTITSWENYTPLNHAGMYVHGAAFPEVPSLTGKVLQEVDRQMFNPEALAQERELGDAELYDFAAIVFPVDMDGKAHVPYNHFVEGRNAKASVRRVGRLNGKLACVILSAVQMESPLSAWTLLQSPHPKVRFIDRTPGAWAPVPQGFNIFFTLPRVELEAPATVSAAGATVSVKVKNSDGTPCAYTGELIIEPLAGYVSKSRVKVVNGVGTFKVIPLGLETGDVIRIKAGARNITGLADATLTVA